MSPASHVGRAPGAQPVCQHVPVTASPSPAAPINTPAPASTVVAPLRLGPLEIATPVVLAPMAGVTNASFRRLCRRYGESALPEHLRPTQEGPLPGVDGALAAPAGLYVTEMVTTRALVERNAKTLAMVRTDPSERVRSIQLYGVDPATVAAAVRILVEEDLADHIDLNFGCPVPKVTRKGGGAALPWKRDLLAAIMRAAVDASEAAVRASGRGREVPVTVKMRLGIDEEHETFLDAARLAADAGISALALHARTARQHYSGQARWEQIARLKEATALPVLGNGDIWNGDDAVAMLRATGCDGVVVGRGCQGRPWLFADIVAALHGVVKRTRPDLDAVISVIAEHGRLLAAELGEDRGVRDLRKHIGWYLKGYPVGGAARRELMRVSSLAELDAALAHMRSRLPETVPFPGAAAEGPRGRAGHPRTPHLPEGWLDSPYLGESDRALLADAELDVSGG
ncbi:tRNA dihydrouridine synthase DusB [Actinomyces sp. MRS3W]|uniref:tRNA dihydrouridine synthase DusB n=1 Tax=Actinomyces sp. MRS3W TaxID=2800796 RepID=UPI0028FD2800|nr:tRNA dihydrouridine synthase DusB [Actinomyces sp. MRS3W]MDU0349494.1 tRNA dihydrouridine synthase DusB [Actinomyces sp. MRS3W]